MLLVSVNLPSFSVLTTLFSSLIEINILRFMILIIVEVLIKLFKQVLSPLTHNLLALLRLSIILHHDLLTLTYNS